MTSRVEYLAELLNIILEYSSNTASVYSDKTYKIISKINNTARILLSNEHIDASNSYLSTIDASYDCEIEAPTSEELETLISILTKTNSIIRYRSLSIVPVCTFVDNVVGNAVETTNNGVPTGQFIVYYTADSNRIERYTTFGTMKSYTSYSRFTISKKPTLFPIASAIVSFTASNTIASTNIPIRIGIVNADSADQMTAAGDPGGQVGAFANTGIYYGCIDTSATLANWVNGTTYSVDVTTAISTVLARTGFTGPLGVIIEHTTNGSNMTISAVNLALTFSKNFTNVYPFNLKVIESQIYDEKLSKALAKINCEWRI